MSNININLGSNIGRGINSNPSQAGVSENTATSGAKAEPSNVSYQNASTNTSLNLLTERMLSTVNTLNTMQAKEFAALVRELLSLPRDLQSLLALLAFGEINFSEMANLLKNLKAQVLLKDLQQLLGQNSKEVINKLIKLTQNNALFFEGSNQLRDVLGLVQKISTGAQISPADALQTAMILYLPWLPLADQQKFELYFGIQEEPEEGCEDIEVLVMFINTANLGTFKVTIILNKDKSIEIDIENDQSAKNIIEKLVKSINQDLAENGIKNKIFTTTRKTPEDKTPKEMKSEAVKSLSLHPSGKISVITVNTGYKIAKAIFNLDEKTTLLKKREEKIK